MLTELELRSDQKGKLYDYLEIKADCEKPNRSLNRKIAKLKSEMLEEDVALVEKNFFAELELEKKINES